MKKLIEKVKEITEFVKVSSIMLIVLAVNAFIIIKMVDALVYIIS